MGKGRVGGTEGGRSAPGRRDRGGPEAGCGMSVWLEAEFRAGDLTGSQG